MKIPIDQIIINERQRLDFGNIESLADSLLKYGQIQPVFVEKTERGYELIAGMRRTMAIKKLGWPEIKITLSAADNGELNELKRQEIELEEDLQRKDRSWQEKALVLLKLHRIKKIDDPSWSLAMTAACTNRSIGNVSEVLNVARILEQAKPQAEEWQKEIWKMATIYEAINIILDKHITLAQSELDRRRALFKDSGGAGVSSVPNCTVSPGETVVQESAPIRIQIFDPLPAYESQSFALAYIEEDVDYDAILAPLAKNGCAILWYPSWGLMLEGQCQLKQRGYIISVPIIWNTIIGPAWPHSPFSLTYRPGLFIAKPRWKNTGIKKEAVISCALALSNGLPLPVVNYSLEDFVQEGALVYCPTGNEAIAVAACGMVPVYNGIQYPNIKEKLIEHYKTIYSNLEII